MNEKSPKSVSVSYMIMGIVFCVCLVAANLLETKVIKLGPLSVTGGLLVFPVSYIINDCIVEVWGFRKMRLVIWLGFAMNFFVVLLGGLACALPSPSYWEGADAFRFIFGLAPRITAASLLAFLVGSFLNALVMSKMKLHDGAHRFSLRAVLSTVAGESADSVIFFPLAFGGLMSLRDLLGLMLAQVVLKTAYELVILPVTIRVVRWVKRAEGTDAVDSGISYNIFKIKEI